MQDKKKYFLLLLLLSATVLPALTVVSPSAYELVRKMFTKARQVQTMRYYLVKRERINGKMKEEKSFIKLMRSPFKVYVKQEYPKAGLEVLYVTGTNNNKALINTNSFPFVSISLDPMSNTMRDEQHHTLLNAGFDYVVNTMEFLLDKYENSAPSLIKDAGDVKWNGRDCHKVLLENPHFRFIDYTVKKGENIIKIADKYRISEYMILERNKHLSSYDDVKPGQVIKIPTDYAQKMIILLDKITLLPILMHIYDDKGVYEQYEYVQIQVNPQISPTEFTKEYKEYKF